MPDGSFKLASQYCDGSKKDTFVSQACNIPHKFLNGVNKMPTCSIMKARVRAHNSVCWGEWSKVNSTGAKIKGPMDNLKLVLVSSTAESASVSW